MIASISPRKSCAPLGLRREQHQTGEDRAADQIYDFLHCRLHRIEFL